MARQRSGSQGPRNNRQNGPAKGGRGRAGQGRHFNGGPSKSPAKGARGAHAKGPKGAHGPKGPKGGSQTPRAPRPTGALVEGRRAVDEALAAGVEPKRAYISLGSGAVDPKLERLAKEFEAEGVEVSLVTKGFLDSLSSHGAHQGIVLELNPFAYADLEDVIDAAGDGDALVVVLDHVTDEGNLGAIVRSAEVVGAAGVVIPKARAAGVGVGTFKTSAGAVHHLPIAQVSNLAAAVQRLQEAGFWACAATEHAHDDLWKAPMGGRLALVMGSEGEGVSKRLRDVCDLEAKLPQRGRIESLNVAQAATVFMYDWLRRQMGSGEGAADHGQAR